MKYTQSTRSYCQGIDLRKIKSMVFAPVESGWHDVGKRNKESRKVIRRLRLLCMEYDIKKRPIMIPVVALKLKSYIKENCPSYIERLIK